MISRRYRILVALVILAFFVGTLALSRHRPIDGDEGYYATAVRLVSEGRTPYLDFFYPQMPLLPYLMAPAYKMVGSSLVNLRLFPVVAGVISLILWGLILVRRWSDRPGIILAGLVLVAVNPYFLSWNVTVKTFALTNLAVLAALWALDHGLQSRSRSWLLLAGVAAGLGVGVRLLYLPWAGMLALALGWLQMRDPRKGFPLGDMMVYLAGLLIGLAPSGVFLALDPDRFTFNNLFYHQLRFSSLERAGAPGGSQVLMALEVLGKALFLNPFMLFQLVLVGLGVDWVRRNPDSPHCRLMILSGAGAVAHTIACLFPDPVYEQYFTSPLTPMLAPLAVAGLVRLTEMVKWRTGVLLGALGLAVVLSVVDLQVRRTGVDPKEVWTFEHLGKVRAAIEGRTEPEDIVLAFWPGYVFESGRQYLPGMENHFALGVSEKLTLEQKIHYHVAGKELLLGALVNRRAKEVIIGAWMHEINTTIEQHHIPIILGEIDSNYQMDRVFGETQILVRRTIPKPRP